MILALDIGNSSTVIGGIDREKTYFIEHASTVSSRTDLEYAILIKNTLDFHGVDPASISGAIMSSVVPPVTQAVKSALKKVLGYSPMIVSSGMKTGMNIRMDNPGSVGSDLIVNAIGALHYYTAPLLIFDLGTATTLSVVDANKNYIGGMILPGMMTALDAMTRRASQLPGIELTPPKKLIGTNTIDSMKSGVFYSNAAMIDGLSDRVEEELGAEATIVATGEYASLIIPFCRKKIILETDLMLKGLLAFYEKNSSFSRK